MAAWQYDFYIIPRTELFNSHGGMLETLTERDRDSTEWWTTVQPNPEFREVLDSIADRIKWWDPSTTVWGDETGNRIDVSELYGRVREVFVRIDLSNLSADFVHKVTEFASTVDCVLVSSEGKVILPDYELLLRDIRASRAQQFVSSPREFLDNIGRKQVHIGSFATLKQRILVAVADDEQRSLFVDTIGRFDYEAIPCPQPELVPQRINELRPDAVLLRETKYMGYALKVLRQIRRDRNLDHIPRLVIFDGALIAKSLDVYEIGMPPERGGYAVEPVSPLELRHCLHRILEE